MSEWEDDEEDDSWEDPEESEQDSAEDEDSVDTQPCPNCGKEVYQHAEQCPHCGQYITIATAVPRTPRWILIAALLALAGFALGGLVWLIF